MLSTTYALRRQLGWLAPVLLLAFGFLGMFRGPITPHTIRIQPVDGAGDGSWIEMPGYSELGSPTFSRDGEWVAFDAYKKGYNHSASECWIARRDGTGLIKLTEGATPRWSPDGAKLIFMRETEGLAAEKRGLFVIGRDGKDERRIGEGRWPDWSPDGESIAFSLAGQRGVWGGTRVKATVYVAKTDGSERRELGEGDCPSWSPDGKTIACCLQDPRFQAPLIKLIELDGTSPRVIGYGWFRANWMPNGKALVANGIYPDGKGSGMVRLSALEPARPAELIFREYKSASSPCYSRDGKSAVFVSGPADPAAKPAPATKDLSRADGVRRRSAGDLGLGLEESRPVRRR